VDRSLSSQQFPGCCCPPSCLQHTRPHRSAGTQLPRKGPLCKLSSRAPTAAQAQGKEASARFRCSSACSPAATPASPRNAGPGQGLPPRLCPRLGAALRFHGGWQWPVKLGGWRFPPCVEQGTFLASSAASGKLSLGRALGGRAAARAGSLETAAAAAGITKMGLNDSGRWGRPCCGRWQLCAGGSAGRAAVICGLQQEGSPRHLPGHRPTPRDAGRPPGPTA